MTSINNNQGVTNLNNQIDNILASYGVNDREQLDELFTEVNTFNEGNAGAQKIQNQIGQLQAKIEDLEKQAQKILEDIEGKKGEVDKNADELAQNASDLKTTTEEFQAKTANAARMATRDAIQSYKNGRGDASFKECFEQAFNKRIGGLSANQKELQALYDLFEANQSKITSITDAIQAGLDKITGLEGQLQNIQGTISLLTRTKNIMENSTVDDAYKNIDTDSNEPIYSGKKAEVANSILKNFGLAAGDAPTTQGTGQRTAEQQKAIDDAMKRYADKNANTGHNNTWHATYSKSPQLQNLHARVEEGMLTELQNLGATPDEILTFVSNTWAVGVRRQGDGFFIPDNSGDHGVFGALAAVASAGAAVNADTVGADQMQNLKDHGLDALKQMYEAGFTFKEAMGVMMKAFPGAGIEYDLSAQDKGRSYSMVADSEGSDGIYKNISDKILEYWNVGANTKTGDSGDVPVNRGHSDPMTFQQGDTTYTFIVDRDNDGTFDYEDGDNNDLLGSKNGIDELIAFDANNDGKLTGKELENLTVMANQQAESVGEDGSKDVDGYKNGANYKNEGAYTNAVDFNMSYSTAAELGITEIDLAGLSKTGMQDNVDEGYQDINGSNVINQFTVTMDGEKITGNETLNTDANLETFYGQVADASNNAGKITTITDQETFDKAFEDAPGSDIIDGVRDKLEQMLEEEQGKPVDTIGGIDITEEDIHNLTGTAYLTGIKNNARIAAEKHLGDENDAADAAEEAVNDYFEERIFGKNGVKEEDEEDKDKDKD